MRKSKDLISAEALARDTLIARMIGDGQEPDDVAASLGISRKKVLERARYMGAENAHRAQMRAQSRAFEREMAAAKARSELLADRERHRQSVVDGLRSTACNIRMTRMRSAPNDLNAFPEAMAAGFHHLADLLQHHGHQGGYPNLSVPSEPEARHCPALTRPMIFSALGSPAAMCEAS
jgi:hypothetical protein